MTLTVRDGGKVDVHSVFISDLDLEPLGEDQLIDIGRRLVEARDEILRTELVETTPNRGYVPSEAGEATPADFLGVIATDFEASQRSVRTARRRRQVTPELLARVLDLYNGEPGGIEEVHRALGYSESYCWKLLRKAREERQTR
jgi:hypothetical protein